MDADSTAGERGQPKQLDLDDRWADSKWARAGLQLVAGVGIVTYLGLVSGHWSIALFLIVAVSALPILMVHPESFRNPGKEVPAPEDLKASLLEVAKRLGVQVVNVKIDRSKDARSFAFASRFRDGTLVVSQSAVENLRSEALRWLAATSMLRRRYTPGPGAIEFLLMIAALTPVGIAWRFDNWWIAAPSVLLLVGFVVRVVKRQQATVFERDCYVLQALGDPEACREALELLETQERQNRTLIVEAPARARLRALFGNPSK